MRYIFLIILVGLLGFSVSSPHRTKAIAPEGKAKNVVLLIGDGMGLSQISASLYDQGNQSVFERFPVIGFQKTYSLENLITDSAASATAIATGVKTTNSSIGVDADQKPLLTILEEAEQKGLATGLVATSSIVHATPASFIAHRKSRNFYEDIALDFLNTDIDLFIGGGKQYFDRRDNDDRNLIEELRKKNYLVFDYFNYEFRQLTTDLSKNFVYFTADNQPLPAMQGRDYLPYAADLALNFLEKKSDKGFFIMIEGSQIDWSCHANQGAPLLAEMRDFDKTVQKVLEFAKQNGETLVIVTADHETGGFSVIEGSKMKNVKTAFTTNGHSGSMVPVFAYGPQAETFGGIYENTAIYHKMRQALGFE